MRVLVCGDRNWTRRDVVYNVLDALQPSVVITGGATGADDFAEQWAIEHEVACQVYPAQWKTFGKAAGPIRNQQMIDEGQPELVLAFHQNLPKSRGTRDMVKRAKACGLEVSLIP